MTWWQIIALAVPGWLAAGALVALVVGRTARIRDEIPVVRAIPIAPPADDNNDLTALMDAVREG